jgi:hypothetical protein
MTGGHVSRQGHQIFADELAGFAADAATRHATLRRHGARGPVNPAQRACAADIARGSPRLWQQPRQAGLAT